MPQFANSSVVLLQSLSSIHDNRTQRLTRYTYSTMATRLEPATARCTASPRSWSRAAASCSRGSGSASSAGRSSEVEEAGFSPYDYSVLALLAEGARETQATIADALGLDRSQLVALLDGLEERGLIDAAARPARPAPPRRQPHAGRQARAGAAPRDLIQGIEDEFFAPLDAEEPQDSSTSCSSASRRCMTRVARSRRRSRSEPASRPRPRAARHPGGDGSAASRRGARGGRRRRGRLRPL